MQWFSETIFDVGLPILFICVADAIHAIGNRSISSSGQNGLPGRFPGEVRRNGFCAAGHLH